jgi:superoxide dismutase, Fe-Mn family
MNFELPKLDYSYDALEPHMDAKTMEIHHTKHHAAYTKNFNDAIGAGRIEGTEAEKIVAAWDTLPSDIKNTVRNHGGGYINHNLFWKVIGPDGGTPSKSLMDEINSTFGSFDAFKEKFSEAAKKQFGSGWAWLVLNKEKKLEIVSTSNQDTPLSQGKVPILALDVWEHAYYLKYQNRRPDFIEAFWNVVNWKEVSRRFEEQKA